VELSVTPLKIGPTYTFSAFLRDISQRKEAEDQMKKTNEELKHYNHKVCVQNPPP